MHEAVRCVPRLLSQPPALLPSPPAPASRLKGFRLAATCGTTPHKESDYSGQANAFQWFYLAVVCPCYITSLCAVASYSHPLSLCVALFAAIWFKVAVCMSLCLHRYAAHAAFQCEGATQLACGILGCLAFQGGLMREPPACPTPQLQLLASSSGGELTVRGPALVGGKAPLAPQVLRRRLARPALSRSDRRREVRPPPPTLHCGLDCW